MPSSISLQSLRTSKKSIIFNLLLASCFTLLTACGKGGGGGDGGGNGGGGTTSSVAVVVSSSSAVSSSSSSVAAVVANPGPDVTVKMGDTVTLNPHAIVTNPGTAVSNNGNLELKGSSTKPMDIVGISWTLVSGTAPTLILSSTTSAQATFVAPPTDSADTITIVYKLTLTRADGQTGTANVTFTVTRVNQLPAANAGSTATAKGLSTVNLQALGTDPDGTITSYAWTQISGAAVVLSTPNANATSFVAPSTNSNIDLVFQIEVADNDNAKATSQVTIHVTPENAPQVALHFPPAAGVYKGATISAFGSTTVTGATISSVTVDIGSGPVAATVETDGTWRVNNLAVPSVTTSFTLQVTATDSLSRVGTTTSTLQKIGTSSGAGPTWTDATGIGVDAETNTAYVLAIGSRLSDVRVFPIDLSNGDRGNDVSNFSYALQGIRSTAFQRLAFDQATHMMYVSVFPSDLQLPRQIVGINTITGQRKLISDATHGTGGDFQTPVGIAIGNNGNIFVADFRAEAILSVDVATGDKTVIANNDTNIYGTTLPTDLAFDNGLNKLYVAPALSPLALIGLDLAANPSTSFLVSNARTNPAPVGTGPAFYGYVSGLVIDKVRQQLFTIDEKRKLFSVDIPTGNRKELLTLAAGKDSFHLNTLAYDEQKHLIYVLEQTTEMSLCVVDPVSGNKVILSGAAF